MIHSDGLVDEGMYQDSWRYSVVLKQRLPIRQYLWRLHGFFFSESDQRMPILPKTPPDEQAARPASPALLIRIQITGRKSPTKQTLLSGD